MRRRCGTYLSGVLGQVRQTVMLEILPPVCLLAPTVNVCVYSNTDVVESFERAGLIYETVRYLVPR